MINKSAVSYIILVVVLVAASILSLSLFLRQRSQHDLLDIHRFPRKLDGWTGQDLGITEKEYQILETRNLIFRDYTNPAGKKIGLFIVYSETNRSVFHPPEVCLIGSGIDIVDKKPERMEFDGRTFLVNKLYLQRDKAGELVLYCYKAANLYTDSYPLQQAYFALHQLLGRRTQGATIRVSMPLGKDEQATLSSLKDFLAETVKIVENF